MIELKSVKFGTDAEVFLRTLSGIPFPVCGLIGGTKENPEPMKGFDAGYAHQEDNAAVEFNIPPTHSIKAFMSSIELAARYLGTIIPQTLKMDWDSPSIEFDEKYLQLSQMQRFGCEPDYNAFTLESNERPQPPTPGFRTAAAHIHIGWNAPSDEDRLELIRLSDVFVTLPTIKKQSELDKERRKLYGKAGAFRPKAYGVEHRVLSNSWLKNPKTTQNTLRAYTQAIAALNSGITVAIDDYSAIIAAINTANTELSETLLKKYITKLNSQLGISFDWLSFYQIFV